MMLPNQIFPEKEYHRIWNKFWNNADNGNYNTLSDDESITIRHIHKELLKLHFVDYKATGAFNLPVRLNDGTPLLNGYNRIVIGNHGAYIEFDADNLLLPIQTKKGQEFREHENYKCKYHWKNPIVNGMPIDVKIYYQIEKVKYADYLVGMYYIDPYEILHTEPITDFDLL